MRRCAGRPGLRARRLLAEVEAWFASDDASWPFAYLTICETLDLNPAYIRSGIMAWRKLERGARHHVVPPRFGRVA